MAPWLELADDGSAEAGIRRLWGERARQAIDAATDPASPDRVNSEDGNQPLVDAAFLAHALLRAPTALWDRLEARTRRNLVAALRQTRVDRKPMFSNWLLFGAMIEAALARMGEPWDHMRVDYAVRQHEQWYLGDGLYSDGPRFHWDYYNSFVIQPMLLDILGALGACHAEWAQLQAPVLRRAQRYAAIQERLIAPDGSYPPLGRSLTYRCGAFQLLSQLALTHRLPDGLPPAQVRCALTAVIRRTMEADGTFDDGGWLTIGLAGHQPSLGEGYISTGSLYLCSTVLLALGLPPDDIFWTGPDLPWTSRRIWAGEDLGADHAVDQPLRATIG